MPKYMEDGRALVKEARKVINYRKDVARPEDVERVRQNLEGLKEALKRRSSEGVQKAENELLPSLGKLQPRRELSGIRENVELIVVAIVLALGIRAYYLQPFKIPTGSMQPTLNGVIGHRTTTPQPDFFVRAFQFLTLGRTYADVTCEGATDSIVSISAAKLNPFWDGSVIRMSSGKIYKVGIDPRSLEDQMRVGPGQSFKKGEPIVRGYADLGDQLFVDKFSYNIFGPHRAEVFVFRTNGILGIPPGPNMESEHYIKRLAGLPGDTLRIQQPLLFVNGHEAQEYGFRRVESQQNGYTGYRNVPNDTMYLGDPNATLTIPKGNYFALGDNSANSYDSRYWGFVPWQNVVGRGMFVYWPFSSHWGFVR
ncbi:MAG: signal peptidase I [Verrucomicrobia bacterium]|nr:signal peptidase I [Verrucomicrobiota bacterium]